MMRVSLAERSAGRQSRATASAPASGALCTVGTALRERERGDDEGFACREERRQTVTRHG